MTIASAIPLSLFDTNCSVTSVSFGPPQAPAKFDPREISGQHRNPKPHVHAVAMIPAGWFSRKPSFQKRTKTSPDTCQKVTTARLILRTIYVQESLGNASPASLVASWRAQRQGTIEILAHCGKKRQPSLRPIKNSYPAISRHYNKGPCLRRNLWLQTP